MPKSNDTPTAVESSELVHLTQQPGELVPGQSQGQAIAFAQTPENIELLKKSLADSKTILTDSELGIFLYQAQKTGLDPLARQIYVMKRDQGGVSFMTSIDGQRLVAQRTREYDGQTPPEWCGKDGKWREVWLEDDNPAAARVGVYRKGMREPIYAVATWKSYARYTPVWRNGQKTNDLKPMGVWGQMGDVMLAKCAEALALRKAFPQELSGLYTPEEMNNADSESDPPRVMSTRDALAQAGKMLVEKGFNRDEALQIMAGIADVEDVSKLNGNKLVPVLEIIEREDATALALYIKNDDSDEAEDDTPEGEVVADEPKSHEQAMHDGDDMPDDFLKKPEADDATVTDEELENIGAAIDKNAPADAATSEPKKLYTVPNWELDKQKLPRPDQRKLYKELADIYSGGNATKLKKICRDAIGKDTPGMADDFITMCNVLADTLNEEAQQEKLV